MGMTGMVLGTMLAREGNVQAAAAHALSGMLSKRPQFAPRAKSIIWLFMQGGTSQMESFDPKPELNRYEGKTIEETPYKGTLESPYLKKNLRELVAGLHKVHPKIFPMQIGYRKRGRSGLEVSDWWPHVGDCIDDIAVVRSMWTTDNNHGAQLQFHTGRHVLEGQFPTIGSWVHYGLGTLNENLPQFVVMGRPIADCCGGAGAHGANYLGPEHQGVQLAIDPKRPLPYAGPGADAQRSAGVLKNRPCRHGRLVAASTANMPPASRLPSILNLALGTNKALRPTQLKQIRPAGRLGPKTGIKLTQISRVIFHS